MLVNQMTTDTMLFILETVALSQQHPSTVVRIAALFLTWTGFGKSGCCCLTSFRGQGMLLLEARGMTWRTKGVDYLLHLEHSFCGAPFLHDPARPGPLRMKSQTEITELAKASPQSVFLQTTHIHVWVEGGKSGKSDSSEELFSPSRSWSVMTRECNSQLLFFFNCLISYVPGRSTFWEFYPRGYGPLLLSLWSWKRLLWPNGQLQMWDTHRSIWMRLWEGLLRERSTVWMHRWVSGLSPTTSVIGCCVTNEPETL